MSIKQQEIGISFVVLLVLSVFSVVSPPHSLVVEDSQTSNH